MNILIILIPASLLLGGVGLVAFLWSLRANQYDDLAGDAWRILSEDDPDRSEKSITDISVRHEK